ncbi:protoporphyrinogen oxidase [Arthrobacter ginkgonis]|uniref:Protoporphyrinogen oxidase n=1 Tax=Arthrobacter ginkgonis TaxID=1630594 RepID=A0ABP7BYT7_9MICC
MPHRNSLQQGLHHGLERLRPGHAHHPDAAPPGPRAVVVGGGISGLVAARELALSGHSVEVFESSAAWGGCVRGHEVAGLALDAGAESFATRSTAVADLATELGLGELIVAPRPGGAWLHFERHGQPVAQPLPATGILGIPGDPWAEDVKSAIGTSGCLRAAADLALPVPKRLAEGTLSLGSLVRSRMGSAVLDTLVTPVVAGVHSADPDTLDVDTVAPGLRAAVVEHGSLARAVAALRAAAPAGSAVGGIAGGMNRLTTALVEDLRARGAVLHTGTKVVRVGHDAGTEQPWSVTVADADGQRTVGAARVVVATEGPAAVDLLSPLLPVLAEHRPAAGAGVSLVTLVVDKPELDAAPRGTGLLVAPGTAGIGAKALTHASAKWQWLADEAGPGTHVLRLSYGRLSAEAARLADADDATLRHQAVADASALLGTALEEKDVLGWDVVRFDGALPFATTGHRDRVAAFRTAIEALPGLDVVGGWLSGTGLAAVVADTRSRLAVSAT